MSLFNNIVASSGNIYPLEMFPLTQFVCATSFRKLRASYTGFLIEVRRSSDNATTNVSPDGNGRVSLSSSVSAGGDLGTWTGSDNLFIRTWYDQSSFANNAVNATAANQTQIATSGVLNLSNSRVTSTWDRARTLNAASASSLDLNTTMTVLTVVKLGSDGGNNNITLFDKRTTAGGAGYHSWCRQATDDEQAQFNGTSPISIQTSNATVPSGTLMSIGYSATKTSTINFVKNGAANGSGTFTSTGSAINTEPLKIGGHTSDVTSQFLGDYSEFILMNSLLTQTQMSQIQQNQKTYYSL